MSRKHSFHMTPAEETIRTETRRQFFSRGARGLGGAALATMMGRASGGLPALPHFAPKAKRAVYLHMVGAPPQMELFENLDAKQWQKLYQGIDRLRQKYGFRSILRGSSWKN